MTLKGSITDLPLAELLQSLSSAKNTGALFVYNGRREAILYFREGELIHCEGNRLEGEESFFDVVHWEGGNFEFIRDRVSPKETISASIPRLLMESARRKDESDALGNADITPTAVPALVEMLPSEEVYLNTLEWGVLSGIDGSRSIEKIAKERNLSVRSAEKIISELLGKKIVKLTNKEQKK